MTDTTTPPGVITVGGLTMTAAQDQIGAALARAQGEVRKARKNARNPHLRNEYADLSSVLDATRGAMAANGLSLVQAPQVTETAAGVRWTLLHSSGQWMSGEVLHATGSAKGLRPAQADGVAISYARRYTLSALLGVATGDDSDGAVEVHGRDRRSGKAIDRRKTHPKVWAQFVEDLAAVNLTPEEVDRFLEARGRPRCHETPDDRWSALVEWATTPETAAKVHA